MWNLMIRLALLATSLVAVPASSKELWERKWIEVRTPHFVIVSALAEERTVDLAHDLESFRRAAEMLTNIGRFEERIPTTIYLLPHRVRELGFRGNAVGYFVPEMRANYAAMFPVSGMPLDDVLKHEYVHFLVHNRDSLSYPPWFDEGFAEVLSTLVARGKRIEYGNVMSNRAAALSYGSWMPFGKLLETRDTSELKGDRAGMFYAQSWLLMHYLLIGRPDRPFSKDNSEYLRLREAGADPKQAFEQAFGIPVRGLQNRLRAYAGRMKYYRGELREPLPVSETQVRPIARDVIAARLGLSCLTRGELEEAQRYYEAALAVNPNNGMALVGMGDLHKFAERFSEAEPHYQKAIAAEPENPLHELDYAEYFLDRAEAAPSLDERRSLLQTARNHFAKSYALDPENPETLAMNGASYLYDGEPIEKAVASLEAAHDLLPSQPTIKFLLAQAYARAEKRKEAIPLLRSLIAWSHAGSKDATRELLASLAEAEREPEADAPSEPAISE